MDSSDRRRALEIIAHACPVPVIALDGGGNVRLWNATAERMLGWKESEVIAKPLPTVPPGGGLPVEVEVQHSFEDEIELRWRTRHGTLLKVGVRVAPWEGDDWAPQGIIAHLARPSNPKLQPGITYSHVQAGA